MSSPITTLLVVSNIATGAALFHFYQLDQQHSETRTTDSERAQFGQACVDWISDQSKEAKTTGEAKDPKLWLGRSWRKHGQMVFEVFSDPDTETSELVEILCTYDKQSGTMFAYERASRDMWMFY